METLKKRTFTENSLLSAYFLRKLAYFRDVIDYFFRNFVEKDLSTEQLKAAEMLARGISETDVATACSKSRSWVQKLKKRDDIQQVINEFQQLVRETVREHTKNNVTEELENFQEQLSFAGRLLYTTSVLFIEKIKARVELLDSEEISPTRIGQNLKQGADALLDALEINKTVLGLDELAQQLNDITKISRNGHESTNCCGSQT